MQHDNPAARLLAFLEASRGFPPTRSCQDCWAELLNVTNGDAALLVARLGRLMELPQMAVAAIAEAFPDQTENCNYWSSKVSAAFMVQNLHGEWQTFNANIDKHTIMHLRSGARLLQTSSPTLMRADEEISAMRKRISDLLEEVVEGDMHLALRATVARALRGVLQALDEYRISGGQGVVEAVEVAVGHVVVDPDYGSFLKNEELGQKILDALGAAANLCTVAISIPVLNAAVMQLLTK